MSTFNGEHIIWDNIPGELELPAGYPVARLSTETLITYRLRPVSITSKSLKHFPVTTNAETFLTKLAHLIWGKPAEDGHPEILPVYKLPGLIRNDCLAPDLPKDSPCGSFNLAATLGKGEGRGHLILAVQVPTPKALSQIKQIVTLVYELWQIALQ